MATRSHPRNFEGNPELQDRILEALDSDEPTIERDGRLLDGPSLSAGKRRWVMVNENLSSAESASTTSF